mmetsp:Transcript_139786/g.243350  ORF Transcript_139786/g.243350 Transcript_139786/m.243350 type:complete len:95 (-) Transcript_139786:1389-1673(-)
MTPEQARCGKFGSNFKIQMHQSVRAVTEKQAQSSVLASFGTTVKMFMIRVSRAALVDSCLCCCARHLHTHTFGIGLHAFVVFQCNMGAWKLCAV